MEYAELNFIIYFTFISFVSFILVAVDKKAAKQRKRRIRESTLFVLSALGGSVAVYLAMGIFNHKTQKNGFVFGISLIFALQCVIVLLVHKYVAVN